MNRYAIDGIRLVNAVFRSAENGKKEPPFAFLAGSESPGIRLGCRLIKTAQLISFVEPILPVALVMAVMLCSSGAAMAQTPGGNIFGSDQQVGNAIREAIKWGRNLLFLMGVVFVGWGVVNYGTEKPAAKQLIAAIACFAFGGIVALVYSISQGNAVNLDTGFGN